MIPLFITTLCNGLFLILTIHESKCSELFAENRNDTKLTKSWIKRIMPKHQFGKSNIKNYQVRKCNSIKDGVLQPTKLSSQVLMYSEIGHFLFISNRTTQSHNTLFFNLIYKESVCGQLYKPSAKQLVKLVQSHQGNKHSCDNLEQKLLVIYFVSTNPAHFFATFWTFHKTTCYLWHTLKERRSYTRMYYCSLRTKEEMFLKGSTIKIEELFWF